MDTRSILIALTFAVIVSVVMLAQDLHTAVFIVGLTTNFIIICCLFSKLSHKSGLASVGPGEPPGSLASGDPNAIHAGIAAGEPEQAGPGEADTAGLEEGTDRDLYLPEHYAYDKYNVAYLSDNDKRVYVPVGGVDVNTRALELMQRRDRNKRSMIGAVCRDVNYYKYHFADELDKAEARPWWGEDDV